MPKPRIKLKSDLAAKPDSSSTPPRTPARPQAATKHSGASRNLEPASALGVSPSQFAGMSADEIKHLFVEQSLAAERDRMLGIIKACEVTGQGVSLVGKLVVEGMPLARAAEYVYDVAAARSDGMAILNSHSPEGGHRKAIDYDKIYSRHNARKEERA